MTEYQKKKYRCSHCLVLIDVQRFNFNSKETILFNIAKQNLFKPAARMLSADSCV